MSDERREYQRLTLGQPLDGWFGDYAVRLLDVSAKAARIEHDEALPDQSRALLRFYWRDQEIEILAETVLGDELSRSRLAFLEDHAGLRQLIDETAAGVLRAQEANASGDRTANVIAGDATLTAASMVTGRGFVTYTLHDGVWRRRASLLPDQPENGFTVSAGEPDEQIEMLCQTFAAGDEEARRVTRMLAELSVAGSR